MFVFFSGGNGGSLPAKETHKGKIFQSLGGHPVGNQAGEVKSGDVNTKCIQEMVYLPFKKKLLYLFPSCSPEYLLAFLFVTPQPCKSLTKPANSAGGFIGIVNLGLTCYMNSVIQCLSNTPELLLYFHDINIWNPFGSGGDLAKSFAQLLLSLWDKDQTAVAENNLTYCISHDKKKAITPREFMTIITKMASQFAYDGEQDAQEFLDILIDNLHEDLNRVQHKPYIEAPDADGRPAQVVADECWRNHKLRENSYILDIFQGQLQSKIECTVCGMVSMKFDPFTSLSIPLPHHGKNLKTQHGIKRNLTLSDCLSEFTATELLMGDAAWYCKSCNKTQKASKFLRISQLPEVLVLHLKRFRFDGTKINTFVNFPMSDLDLSSFCMSGKANPKESVYDLYAVIHHHSWGGGLCHYSSMARCPNITNTKISDVGFDPDSKILHNLSARSWSGNLTVILHLLLQDSQGSRFVGVNFTFGSTPNLNKKSNGFRSGLWGAHSYVVCAQVDNTISKHLVEQVHGFTCNVRWGTVLHEPCKSQLVWRRY
uniref:ubiquitinyl hydrolase 1 n=1 Tax=Eptatretus burgeri TaxID=7764 RepID=A0A8C4Q8H2_EPTBU